MNDIVLELGAALLSLYLLLYSLTVRRALYRPFPRGLKAVLQCQHCIFLAALGTLCLTSLSSVATGVAQSLHAPVVLFVCLHTLRHLLRSLIYPLLLCYILNLCGKEQVLTSRRWPAFCLPLLLGTLVLLTNPLTQLCFSVDKDLGISHNALFWVPYAASGCYIALALGYFLRAKTTLSLMDRVSALVLVLVAASGILIQAIWSVLVELFFESVALFGVMAALEHDDDVSEKSMSDRFRGRAVVALMLTFLMVMVMNITLILNLTTSQSNQIGNTQLDVIRSDLEDTIKEAETSMLRVSMDIQELIDADASREDLARFLDARRISFLSHEDFLNVYIGGRDWHIVPGFDAPADFHASERVWYIGAVEHAGDVYITEPYKDADTGDMCFTVSTALSDGETVVGMDLNFSKAQESILRMTEGTDRTAMIVTSGGLIAGYSDMSLVGERAE